jgi:hypothetical protein
MISNVEYEWLDPLQMDARYGIGYDYWNHGWTFEWGAYRRPKDWKETMAIKTDKVNEGWGGLSEPTPFVSESLNKYDI